METINKREAWNTGKLVGQKPPPSPRTRERISNYSMDQSACRKCAMHLADDRRARTLKSLYSVSSMRRADG
jgi:hypothetical protein